MRVLIQSWLEYLEGADPLLGLPLLLLGLGLMFMGWHFQRAVVPFMFLLIGMIIGQLASERLVVGLSVGAGLGIVLAIISHLTPKASVSVLGGLSGSFILTGYLSIFERLVLPPMVDYGILILGFVGGSALAFIMFKEMIMVMTAFFGTLFLVCGLNTILPQTAAPLYATVTQFLNDYPALLIPFLVGGPTLIGTLVQMSNANRGEAGAV